VGWAWAGRVGGGAFRSNVPEALSLGRSGHPLRGSLTAGKGDQSARWRAAVDEVTRGEAPRRCPRRSARGRAHALRGGYRVPWRGAGRYPWRSAALPWWLVPQGDYNDETTWVESHLPDDLASALLARCASVENPKPIQQQLQCLRTHVQADQSRDIGIVWADLDGPPTWIGIVMVAGAVLLATGIEGAPIGSRRNRQTSSSSAGCALRAPTSCASAGVCAPSRPRLVLEPLDRLAGHGEDLGEQQRVLATGRLRQVGERSG